ncbi:MAG: PD40 domain-containing protein [Spirochaetales bacterium]|nr:PD40 domain-containing protein [Spirochaetales bacterium]
MKIIPTPSRWNKTGLVAKNVLIAAAALIVMTLALGACSRSYSIAVQPPDARIRVDGRPVEAGKRYTAGNRSVTVTAAREGYEAFRKSFLLPPVLGQERIEINLPKEKYPVVIKLAQGKAEIRVDGGTAGPAPFRGQLEYGGHEIVFAPAGAPALSARVFVRRPETFLFRLQPGALPVTSLGIYPCGSQPKQAIFSPDDRYLYLPLLNDVGFQIFDMEKREMLSKVSVGPKPKLKGFPEGLFIEKYKSFLISQMSTNYIYEYSYGGDGSVVFKRMFPSRGVFPKFLAYAPSLDLVAVSNWLTNDVTLFDYGTARAVGKIPGLKTPRGVAFSPDDKWLYIASYDGGNVFKYDTETWKESKRFYSARASMRHLALDPPRNRFFVSDMAKSLIFELDMESLALIHTYKTFYLPNTISLDSAGKFLFVSCRGPNNPKNYTLRSPRDSLVNIFDTEKKTLVGSILGGNQPTGLDVSSDGRYLVFTNFQDANFEIYDISGLYAVKSEAETGGQGD